MECDDEKEKVASNKIKFSQLLEAGISRSRNRNKEAGRWKQKPKQNGKHL